MKPSDIRYIVVHCSATRADHPYPVEALESDHIARGFRGAGYHFYIRRSGVIHPLRPLERIGAHALGYNRCSWGVCYEGGLSPSGEPQDTRTSAQREALHSLLRHLLSLAPTAHIVGHRELSPDRNGDGMISPAEWRKACPSFDASSEYASLTPSPRPHHG